MPLGDGDAPCEAVELDVTVEVGEREADGVETCVAVRVTLPVIEPLRVCCWDDDWLGLWVIVAVVVPLAVCVAEGVSVPLAVGVETALGVWVSEALWVTVGVAVPLGLWVLEGVRVALEVNDELGVVVALLVEAALPVCVSLALRDSEAVRLGVPLGDAVLRLDSVMDCELVTVPEPLCVLLVVGVGLSV